MKIYVDESFQGEFMFLSAIVISETKEKEAYKKIRLMLNKHKIYNHPELKLNKIKTKYPKKILKNTKKFLEVFSSNIYFSKTNTKQGTTEFYEVYSNFLRTIQDKFPTAEITIDQFGNNHKILNYDTYEWKHSSNSKGLQLADLSIYCYKISKDLSNM